MNKEQQIREMAEKMQKWYEKNGLLNFKWFAEALYNAGYRKVEKTDTIFAMLNIQSLLQDFDEMGYAPTTLCENPEEEAKQWKQNIFVEVNLLLDELDRLQAENNRLSEKLKQVLLSIDTVKEMNTMCNIDEKRKQAVKEFAERLKAKAWQGYQVGMYIVNTQQIDELLKEYEQ